MNDEDYLRETEKRKAQNYNARMNWWNDFKGPKGPIHEAMGCVIGVAIIFGILIIIAIIMVITDAL